jgi:thiol:disulfide interchange protein
MQFCFAVAAIRRFFSGFAPAFKCVVLSLSLVGLLWLPAPAAVAGLLDDHFDGNIFALYGGNGSLIPPKVTLQQAFERQKPVFLTFYVNDSTDCKQFSTVVSQVQAFYGRAIDIIPINADAIPSQAQFTPDQPGYYYQGVVPQTVVFDGAGKQLLNLQGRVDFEPIDDVFRQVFDLLPRSESVTLRRRLVNEINVELAQ